MLATGCGSSAASSGAKDSGASGDDGGGLQDSGVAQDATPEVSTPEAATEASTTGCTMPDAGFPAGYPATHAPFPTVTYQGAGILQTPEVVTVTFPGDTLAPQLEQFDDDILQTCWWDTVRAGYCTGAGGAPPCLGRGVVPANAHVELTTAASATYTDADVQTFVQTEVASGTFPPPDANTVYVLYFPETTVISDPGLGTSCQTFGGYHGSTSVTPQGGSATSVAYAVVPRCMQLPYFNTAFDQLTFDASHEITEAATDPYATGQGAGFYLDFGTQSNQPWNLVAGGEIGDLCVDVIGEGQYTPHDQFTAVGASASYTVQRMWSVEAANAGGDPCVPIGPSDAPYFNTAIAAGSNIQYLAVGSSATFEADAFSTAPGTTWSVVGFDWTSYTTATTSSITVTPSQAMVSNGDKIMVTVTLNSQPPEIANGIDGAVFLLLSSSGGTFHTWAGIVVAQ
jgi:hypothetical protein